MTKPTVPDTRPTSTASRADDSPPGPAASTTRLLACGVAAGPLFIVAGLIQALTRAGFNLNRNAVSLLTIGHLGWIQIANFMVSGLLIIAGGVGMRRVLRGGPGGKWAPLLMWICGAGMIAGGTFHPDPSDGFPPGTPAHASAVTSWHGVLHLVSGSAAFLALIALCFVLARRFTASGQRGWAVCSRVCGALFAVALAASGAPHGSLTLFVGAAIAFFWVALTCARLIAEQAGHVAVSSGISTPRHQPAVERPA